MADQPPLYRDLTTLLEGLPQTHLIEIARQAAIGGFKGACRQSLGERKLEDVLRSLFPDFSEAQISAAVTEMTLCALRNRCWSQMLSLPDMRSIQMRCANPKRAQALRDRKGPVILTFWHLGASFMMGIGLQRIGVPGTIIARNPPPPWYRRAVSPQTRMVVTSDDSRKAVIALKVGLDELRKGGVVVVALDGSQGQKDFTVPFLGRRIPLSRGMAVLSRLTGAPIVPCGVTWGEKDWTLDFRLFEPVPLPAPGSASPDEWEKQVLTAAASRFETIVRAFPGQTRLERLSVLADAPRA